MRNLIAALIAWLMPSSGKHRAAPVPTQPVRPVPAPRYRRAPDVIDADALPIVRPFVLAAEERRERQRQRDRRRAAVLATMGQDMPERAV